MSDTSLNKIIQYGTLAERTAFVPDPASGSQVLYVWYETDNAPDIYVWDGSAWVLINAGSTPDLVKIDEVTPSGTGVVTFSSLGAYNHLEIRFSARSTEVATGSGVNIRFNADGGSNYLEQRASLLGTTDSYAQQVPATTSAIAAVIAGASSPANYPSTGTISIEDYRGTTFYKIARIHSNNVTAEASDGLATRLYTAWWKNAGAITSITLTLASGNYVAGSKFTLYGKR